MYASSFSIPRNIPEGICKRNTQRSFTKRYSADTIKNMSEYTREQRLLMRIRDDHCGGKTATLAKRIDRDYSYVHRLFYPVGKKGGKGIGLEIMKTCSAVFKLEPGYWDDTTENQYPVATATVAIASEPAPVRKLEPKQSIWIQEAIDLLQSMNESQKAAAVVLLRQYAQAIGPPRSGQAL